MSDTEYVVLIERLEELSHAGHSGNGTLLRNAAVALRRLVQERNQAWEWATEMGMTIGRLQGELWDAKAQRKGDVQE